MATTSKKQTRSKKAAPPLDFRAELESAYGKDFCQDVEVAPGGQIETATGYIEVGTPWPELAEIPGVPTGHISVIHGDSNTGKTSLAMHAMVAAQEQGYRVFLLDTEYKFNFGRFVALGGDLKKLHRFKRKTIEQVFDTIEKTMNLLLEKDPQAKAYFVWDSLGMTPTESELNSDAFAKDVAPASRVVKRNLRRMMAFFEETHMALTIVNHIYEKMGVMFGESKRGYGGKGAYFAGVIVIETKRIGTGTRTVKGKKEEYGLKTRLVVRKNHLTDAQGRKVDVRILPAALILESQVKKYRAQDTGGEILDVDELASNADVEDSEDAEL